jgi:hypothetical protein
MMMMMKERMTYAERKSRLYISIGIKNRRCQTSFAVSFSKTSELLAI